MTAAPSPVGFAVAGLLLTGGSSRRMGADKSRIMVHGRRLSERVASILEQVVAPVLEVGPGVSGLREVREPEPGAGPLAAIAAGWDALCGLGRPGPALVLACDLPLVSVELLELLAGWPGEATVLPVVAGRTQPLCARWSPVALAGARGRLAHDTSMRHVEHATDTILIDVSVWGRLVDASVFADVDRPEDLKRLGLQWDGAPRGGT